MERAMKELHEIEQVAFIRPLKGVACEGEGMGSGGRRKGIYLEWEEEVGMTGGSKGVPGRPEVAEGGEMRMLTGRKKRRRKGAGRSGFRQEKVSRRGGRLIFFAIPLLKSRILMAQFKGRPSEGGARRCSA